VVLRYQDEKYYKTECDSSGEAMLEKHTIPIIWGHKKELARRGQFPKTEALRHCFNVPN
jgi:hypothetical protein